MKSDSFFTFAISTESSVIHCALLKDSTCIMQRSQLLTNTITEDLIHYIDSVLSDAQVTLADLNLLCVTVGPGAYTGLRIVSVVKSMAQSLSIPMISCSSFHALLIPYKYCSGIYLTALPGRKQDLNIQLNRITNQHIQCLTDPMVWSFDHAQSTLSRFKEPIYCRVLSSPQLPSFFLMNHMNRLKIF